MACFCVVKDLCPKMYDVFLKCQSYKNKIFGNKDYDFFEHVKHVKLYPGNLYHICSLVAFYIKFQNVLLLP